MNADDATKDTISKRTLEAKSTVETSSNTFIKTKTLDSLDVTCVLVGVAVNLIVCIDKLEVNSHSSTSKEFNPIFSAKMLPTKRAKLSDVCIQRIALTSKVGITH
jgi:hypothetical protein